MARHYFLHIQKEIDAILGVVDNMTNHATMLTDQVARLRRHQADCNSYISKQYGEITRLRSMMRPKLDLLPEENMRSSVFEMTNIPYPIPTTKSPPQEKQKSKTKSKTKSQSKTKSKSKAKSISSVEDGDDDGDEEEEEEQDDGEEEQEEQEQKSDDNQSNAESAGSNESASSEHIKNIKKVCKICYKADPTKPKRHGHSGPHYKDKNLSEKRLFTKKDRDFLIDQFAKGLLTQEEFSKMLDQTTRKRRRTNKEIEESNTQHKQKNPSTPKFDTHQDDSSLPKKRKVRTPKRFTESVQ